jgi:hypothetical protein
VTCLLTLLTAFVVIAASLLGGCSDNAITSVGSDAKAPIAIASADRASPQAPDKPVVAVTATSQELGQQLASVALDDTRLSDVRGGFDTGSGVTLNFAFQQATFVNHNLAESVVVPTLTIAQGQGGVAASGAGSMTGVVHPNVNVGSLVGLGITGAPSANGTGGGVSTATVVANGGVQSQVSVSTAALQALVNSGMASVMGPAGSHVGNGGVSTTISNTANNQLIQQMTTVDIGVSGLSKLLQQGIPSTVMGRLSGPNSFR